MRVKFLVLLLGFFLTLPAGLSGQAFIWPGDINNSGEVTEVDVLYWGVAYGAGGSVRPAAKTDWIGQPPPDLLWTQFFPNGLNYAFADADGSGLVDDADLTTALIPNFLLRHGQLKPDTFQRGVPGIDPALELVPSKNTISGGESLQVDLLLGDQDLPVEQFYGISFWMHYNPAFVKEPVQFTLDDNTWVAAGDRESIQDFAYQDEAAGLIRMALVRKDQQSISGSGLLGTFSIIIEDIIFSILEDSLELTIDSIKLITEELQEIPAVPDQIKISKAQSVPTKTVHPLGAGQLYPNPASDHLVIYLPSETPGTPFRLRIINQLGQVATDRQYPSNQEPLSIPLTNWPPGSYALSLEYANRIYTGRFIILHPE